MYPEPFGTSHYHRFQLSEPRGAGEHQLEVRCQCSLHGRVTHALLIAPQVLHHHMRNRRARDPYGLLYVSRD